jgi:hypothetical protein
MVEEDEDDDELDVSKEGEVLDDYEEEIEDATPDDDNTDLDDFTE